LKEVQQAVIEINKLFERSGKRWARRERVKNEFKLCVL
jgi:hypothetical protein